MSSALAPSPLPAFAERPELEPRHGGGKLTLERRLEDLWEGLHADGLGECPLCRGSMLRVGERAAACADCGTELR